MDQQSDVAISLAHLRLPVSDLAAAIDFFEAMGGEADVRQDQFAVVALADGTRLQLSAAETKVAAASNLQFDFRVADIDAAWAAYTAKGLSPGAIQRRVPGHDSFIVIGPDGAEVKINGAYTRA
jgi:catechol 2,3-dioxygenase-like lactoylglutathione lyase family enzyme